LAQDGQRDLATLCDSVDRQLGGFVIRRGRDLHLGVHQRRRRLARSAASRGAPRTGRPARAGLIRFEVEDIARGPLQGFGERLLELADVAWPGAGEERARGTSRERQAPPAWGQAREQRRKTMRPMSSRRRESGGSSIFKT